MTNTSKATQIKAVERILALRKNGANLVDAKTIVSNEFNVSMYKVTQWFKTHKPTRTTFTAKANHKASSQVSIYSFNDMSNDIRGVLKSVVNQDGRYSTKEAGVIGKLYGAELTKAKLLLEVHKHNTKVSGTTVNNNILSLS